MGRPRSASPFVVVSVRLPPELIRRIKATGPLATVMREALEKGLPIVARKRRQAELLAAIRRLAKRDPNGRAVIAELRQALPRVHPTTFDNALLELERLGEVAFHLIVPNNAPPGGLTLPGRGLAWWVSPLLRSKR